MSIEFKEDPNLDEPIRLALRTEGEWVVAHLVCDALKMQRPIATISVHSLNNDAGLFEQWKSLLTGHLVYFMETMDLTVDRVVEKEADT